MADQTNLRNAYRNIIDPLMSLTRSRDPNSSLGDLSSTKQGLSGSGVSSSSVQATISRSKDNLLNGASSVFAKDKTQRVSASILNSTTNRNALASKSANQIIQEGRNSVNGVVPLIFPTDLPRIYMTFSFADYVRPSGFEQLELNPTHMIALPVAENIFENYGVTIQREDTNFGGDIARNVDTLSTLIQDAQNDQLNINSINEYLRNTASSTALVAGGRLGLSTLNTLGGAISSPIGDIASQFLGATPNPHPSVFFKGVELRTHTLNWKLSAQNEDESRRLKDIIDLFKNNMLPEIYDGFQNSFLKYPKVIKPEIRGTDYAPPYKYCFVRTMNIIHTPDGGPAYYKSGAPVTYLLTIELQEIEYFLANDTREITDGSSFAQIPSALSEVISGFGSEETNDSTADTIILE